MSDYSVFASTSFDPNDYANAILAGEPYSVQNGITSSTATRLPNKLSAPEASAKEDISLAISKLSFGIDDVSKQIKNLVTVHHEDLLSQAANASQLSGSLTSVRAGLTDLDSSLDKLRLRISMPYQSLHSSVDRLQKFQQASDILRRTSRFVVLARRLRGQIAEMEARGSGNETLPVMNGSRVEISQRPESVVSPAVSPTVSTTFGIEGEDEKERTIAKAALSIAELDALLDDSLSSSYLDLETGDSGTESTSHSPDEQAPSEHAQTKFNLRLVHAVAAHAPFIEDTRAKVTSEMENMVVVGLTSLNQSLLASSFQTAYNLRILPRLVQGLVADLAQAVEDRIKSAFDLSKISKDAAATGKDESSSPVPSLTSSPTLYKSRIRTEPTNVTAPQWAAALWIRLEKMTEEMADCCVKVYTLEKVLKMKKDTVSQAVFLDVVMTLLENKPSATFWTALGRSLEKYTKDSARGSSFLQQTLSTGYPRLLRLFHEFFAKIAVHTDTVYIQTYQSPETVLVLRSLSNFEALYLSRSSNKLNEVVGQAFAGGTRIPPGFNDGVNIARTITNELDSARFDPLLVRSIAKNVVSSLETMISRADSLIVRDRSAVLLSGPTATPAQTLNASIATCLHACHSRLLKLSEEHTEVVFQLILGTLEKVYALYDRVVDSLLTAIRRELSSIIARLHRIDFGKSADPTTGMGGSSFYMKDLVDKLNFVKTEVLSKFAAGDDNQKWVISITKFVLRTFVLHVSITQPLSESGKLQLTTDMTELEFALSAFMADNTPGRRGGKLESLGDEYRVLRGMRPLLFLENSQLASPAHTDGVPSLIVLHHILVRSPLPLPHTLHGWQEAEYVRWVDEHSEEEARTLVEGGLSHWEKINESEGDEQSKEAKEYIRLARTVLRLENKEK